MAAPATPGIRIAYVVDDEGGMMFNHRRVSRDSRLRTELLKMARASGGRLLVRPYSLSQFEAGEKVLSSERPWEGAGPDDLVFIEDVDPAEIPGVQEATRFCWNRRYPSDLKSTLDLGAFGLEGSDEFPGSSHERITRETWRVLRPQLRLV